MISEHFYSPRRPVTVVALGTSAEALLIRSILESLGAVTTLHLPATPEDFLMGLNQSADAPKFTIISAHGDENGFVMEEMASGISDISTANGCLPIQALMGHLSLPNKIVLNTACLSGSDAFKQTFLDAGVQSYIAPTNYPEAAAIPLFVHSLFYELFQSKVSLQTAFARAQMRDEDSDLMRLFEAPN